MFSFWRSSLRHFLGWFNHRRATGRYFYLKLFLFFVALNLACYWWALLTTYPQHLTSYKGEEYVLMGFPISVMGALFDSLSLFVTLLIVRRALAATDNIHFVAYLSVDLLIAVLATFWVLFAFIASGWVVSFILERPETFASRTVLYEGRVWSAFQNPFNPDSIRQIYFGIIMGASALLPTLFHLYLAGLSAVRSGIALLFRKDPLQMKYEAALKMMFFIGVLGVGVLSLLPQAALPEMGLSDKFEHLMAYSVLGLVGCRAFPDQVRRTLVWLILYGIILEALQSLVPGRIASLMDVAANTVGVGLGYLILQLSRKTMVER